VVSSFAFAFESAFGPESKCDSGGDVVIVACDRVLLWRLVGWLELNSYVGFFAVSQESLKKPRSCKDNSPQFDRSPSSSTFYKWHNSQSPNSSAR
jgi:hypothetical protein